MLKRIIIPMLSILVISVPLAAQDEDVTTLPPTGSCFDSPTPPCLTQANDPDTFKNNRQFGQAQNSKFKAQQKQRQHLEQLRMLKLLEMLDLKEDQELEFLTSFRTMRRENGELQGRKIELVDKLVELLSAETIDDSKVNRAVEDIMQLEQERGKIMENFIGEVRGFLSAEQLGKLIVFQEKFEVQLLENLKNFHSRKGRNP